MNCNRLTKNKKPCQNPASFYTACRIHATEQDKEIFKWGQEQWDEGYKIGEKTGRNAVKSEMEQAKRKAEYEVKEKENFRLRDLNGRQLVCCGKYSYSVPINQPDLKVGNVVRLPANWLVNHQTTAEITALGSSYTGDIFSIVGVEKNS